MSDDTPEEECDAVEEAMDEALENFRVDVVQGGLIALEGRTDREIALLALAYSERCNAVPQVLAVLHACALRLMRAGWAGMDEAECEFHLNKLLGPIGEPEEPTDPAHKPS